MTISPNPRASKTPKVRIPPRLVFTDPWCFLGFGFGTGLSSWAPGTLGTLAAAPIFALMQPMNTPAYIMVLVVWFVIGIVICQHCELRLRVSDHPGIVWDEIVGYLVTMTGMPLSWQHLALGFALFRLFDIIKPWPIRLVDRHVHGGFGIMLDDLLAGLLAALVLHWLAPILVVSA